MGELTIKQSFGEKSGCLQIRMVKEIWVYDEIAKNLIVFNNEYQKNKINQIMRLVWKLMCILYLNYFDFP